MGRGVQINIKGMKSLLDKLGQIPENVKKEIEVEMSIVGNDYVNKAQRDAPQDERFLANHITLKKKKEMSYEVVSPAPYSAYVEFGTKSRFRAIPGIDSSKFKGKGNGDYYDFLNNILDWVKRKGIASRFSVKTKKKLKHTATDLKRIEQTARAIAYYIIKNGVHPHPFFFKHLPEAKEQFNRVAKAALKRAMK